MVVGGGPWWPRTREGRVESPYPIGDELLIKFRHTVIWLVCYTENSISNKCKWKHTITETPAQDKVAGMEVYRIMKSTSDFE